MALELLTNRDIGSYTLKRVNDALYVNGYLQPDEDAKLLAARFVRRTEDGQKEIHHIVFENQDDGELDVGTVYVWVNDAGDKLIADY